MAIYPAANLIDVACSKISDLWLV